MWWSAMTSEQNRAEKYLGTGLREDIVQDGTLKKSKQTGQKRRPSRLWSLPWTEIRQNGECEYL